MNYTTLTINGEKVGLKFGMASFRYLSEGKFVEGKAFADNQLTEIGIAHILYSGYYNNCLVKEAEINYSFEDFVDFIEMNFSNEKVQDEIKNVLEIWAKSEFLKPKEEVSTESKKKNTRGRK